jgi:hypothetical protein
LTETVLAPGGEGRLDGIAARPLCPIPGRAPALWVAWRFAGLPDAGFLTRAALERHGMTEGELERAGARQFRRVPADWEAFIWGGGVANVGFGLICSDRLIGAARILDQPFMRHAHRMLRAPCIAAIIPRRETLVVATSDHLCDLAAAARNLHADAVEGQLSERVYSVVDGEVCGEFSHVGGKWVVYEREDLARWGAGQQVGLLGQRFLGFPK